MRYFFFSLLVIVPIYTNAQLSEAQIDSIRVRHEQRLMDTASHLLKKEEIEEFGGLDYFPFNEEFQVQAKFTKDKGKVFKMPTSTERMPKYRRFGYVDFAVNGESCRLAVYQNIALKKHKEYKNHLFVPMRDATSSEQTYGGGRYLDLEIPEGDEILLDFNLLYNPYCAYSYRYSCPIPPEENTLKVRIEAGEKTPLGH